MLPDGLKPTIFFALGSRFSVVHPWQESLRCTHLCLPGTACSVCRSGAVMLGTEMMFHVMVQHVNPVEMEVICLYLPPRQSQSSVCVCVLWHSGEAGQGQRSIDWALSRWGLAKCRLGEEIHVCSTSGLFEPGTQPSWYSCSSGLLCLSAVRGGACASFAGLLYRSLAEIAHCLDRGFP